MSFLRNATRHLASNGFRLGVFGFAAVSILLMTFGSAATVKSTLDKSGVYESLAAISADQAQQGNGIDNQASAALEQPEVKDAIKQTLSPQLVKSSGEQIIDGTYRWLDGEVAQPDFKVDLTPAIESVKNQAADAAVSRFEKLPACSLQQLREINPATIDIFKLPCRPPGVNADQQRQQLLDNINASTADNEFLGNPVITADRLSQSSRRNLFQTASTVPTSFQWLQKGPLIFGLLSLVCALAVVFLHRTRKLGVRSLAFSLIISGALLLVIGLLANYLVSNYITQSGGPLHLDQGGPQQAAVKVIGTFDDVINRGLFIYGIGYAALGAIVLLALRFIKPRWRPVTAVQTGRPGPATHAPDADSPIKTEKRLDDKLEH